MRYTVARLEMLRGSDVTFNMVYPGIDGLPLDLTGWTVTPFEEHEDLVGNLGLEITDAINGQVTGTIQWDNKYRNGNHMRFRVQLNNGEDQRSTPVFVVSVL